MVLTMSSHKLRQVKTDVDLFLLGLDAIIRAGQSGLYLVETESERRWCLFKLGFDWMELG